MGGGVGVGWFKAENKAKLSPAGAGSWAELGKNVLARPQFYTDLQLTKCDLWTTRVTPILCIVPKHRLVHRIVVLCSSPHNKINTLYTLYIYKNAVIGSHFVFPAISKASARTSLRYVNGAMFFWLRPELRAL